MKTITATELHQHLDKYLSQAQVEEIVIRLENGVLVRLSPIDPEDLVDEIVENDPRFEQIIAARRKNYAQTGGVSYITIRQTLIEELTQDLNHPDPKIREEAVQYLTLLGESISKDK